MLIDFTVENYASFRDETVLSAETGERLRKFKKTNTFEHNGFKLLKSLALFGPNGSGKTNMIDGLRRMRDMVMHDPRLVTDKLPYNPFRGDMNSRRKPQMFDVRFTYGDKSYHYRYSFDRTEIIYEMLAVITPRKEKIYFERIGQEYPILPERLADAAEATKSNTLFLYMAQRNNDKLAIEVVRWFQELIFVDDLTVPQRFMELLEDERIKRALVDFLGFADLSIIDFKTRTVNAPKFPDEIKNLRPTRARSSKVRRRKPRKTRRRRRKTRRTRRRSRRRTTARRPRKVRRKPSKSRARPRRTATTARAAPARIITAAPPAQAPAQTTAAKDQAAATPAKSSLADQAVNSSKALAHKHQIRLYAEANSRIMSY